MCVNVNLITECLDSKNNPVVSNAVFTTQSGLILNIEKNSLSALGTYEFKLRGTRNGVVIEDSILLNIIQYDMPPV